MSNHDEPEIVYFLDESVLETAGKKFGEISQGQNEYAPVIEFVTRLATENIERESAQVQRISFTTQEILGNAKTEDWSRNMKHVGKPLVYPVENPNEGNFKSEELIYAANDKHHEIQPQVILVCAEDDERKFMQEKVDEKDYPIEVVDVEEAIEKGCETDLDIDF